MFSIPTPLLFILWSQLTPTGQLELPSTLKSDHQITPSQIEQSVQFTSCVGNADSVGPKTEKHSEMKKLRDIFEGQSNADEGGGYGRQQDLGCIFQGSLNVPMSHNVPVIHSCEKGVLNAQGREEPLQAQKEYSSLVDKQQQSQHDLQETWRSPFSLSSSWNPGAVELSDSREAYGYPYTSDALGGSTSGVQDIDNHLPKVPSYAWYDPQFQHQRSAGGEVSSESLPETLNWQSNHYQEGVVVSKNGIPWPSIQEDSPVIVETVNPTNLNLVPQSIEYSHRKLGTVGATPETSNCDYITQVLPGQNFWGPDSSLMLLGDLPKTSEGIYASGYPQAKGVNGKLIDLDNISTYKNLKTVDDLNWNQRKRYLPNYSPLSDLTLGEASGSGNPLDSGTYHIEDNHHRFDLLPPRFSVNQESIQEVLPLGSQKEGGKRTTLQDSQGYQERFNNSENSSHSLEKYCYKRYNYCKIPKKGGWKKVVRWVGRTQWIGTSDHFSDLLTSQMSMINVVHQNKFPHDAHEQEALISDGWEFLQEILEQWVKGDLIDLPGSSTRQCDYFDGTQPINLFQQLSKPPSDHVPIFDDTLWQLWKRWYRSSSNPSKRFFAFQSQFNQEIETTLIEMQLMGKPVGLSSDTYNRQALNGFPSNRVHLLRHYLQVNSLQVKNCCSRKRNKKLSQYDLNMVKLANAQNVGRFEIQVLGFHFPVEEWFDKFHEDLQAQINSNQKTSMSINPEIVNLVKKTYFKIVTGFFGSIRLLHLNQPMTDAQTLDPLIEDGWKFLIKFLGLWRNLKQSHPFPLDCDHADRTLALLTHEAHELYAYLFQQQSASSPNPEDQTGKFQLALYQLSLVWL
ncbi:hypothetical protein CROQUDRAFT_701986 [Cronartium quercuum f. sp. fusiforme G11]|uniref:Uncharacterized protein n=1 Tax=Cronartium quercuum f. sp. fusiforme G11 TaxID=708437 RepID=A0A9P6T5E2_9BASI|nr:hypothetical protein CROQUDRAFT_701986 [Cronartium quercuum f. sp. fusiforme G11]